MEDALEPTGVGLNELKKYRVMKHVAQIAMQLFYERGFDAVTVEEVAAAAEVSPSTIYRYFGTKERLVHGDGLDMLVTQRLAVHLKEGAPPPVALRLAMMELVDLAFPSGKNNELLKRLNFKFSEPALEAEMHNQLREMELNLRTVIAANTANTIDDYELQLLTAVSVTALMVSIRRWQETGGAEDVGDLIKTALHHIEQGFSPS
jgi:AcrR family transcriptional regulator